MDNITSLLAQLNAVGLALNGMGVLGCVAMFIVGLVRRWWVLGSFYKELERREAEWKSAAQNSQNMADRLADHALRPSYRGR